MNKLQRTGNLFDIVKRGLKTRLNSACMAFTKRAIRRIVHDEKRCSVFQAELQNSHDMRMYQAGSGTRFSTKLFYLVTCQLSTQYFDGCTSAQVSMFAQVDCGEPSSPQELHKTIITQLLSHILFAGKGS